MNTEKSGNPTPPNELRPRKTTKEDFVQIVEDDEDVIILDGNEGSFGNPKNRRDAPKRLPKKKESPKKPLKIPSDREVVWVLDDEETDTLSASQKIIRTERKPDSLESAVPVANEDEKVLDIAELNHPFVENKSDPSEGESGEKETHTVPPTTESFCAPSTAAERKESSSEIAEKMPDLPLESVVGTEEEMIQAAGEPESDAKEKTADEDDWEDIDDEEQEGDEEDNGSAVADTESVDDDYEPFCEEIICSTEYKSLDEEKKRRADGLMTRITQLNDKITHMETSPEFLEQEPSELQKFNENLEDYRKSYVKFCDILLDVCGTQHDSKPVVEPKNPKDNLRTDVFAEYYSKFRYRGTGHKPLDDMISHFVRIVFTADEKKAKRIQGVSPESLNELISGYSKKKLGGNSVLGPSGYPVTGDAVLEGINRRRERIMKKIMSERVLFKYAGTKKIKLPDDPELERKLRQKERECQSLLENVTVFCEEKKKEGYKVAWDDIAPEYVQSSDEEADDFDITGNVDDGDALEEAGGSGSCHPSTSAATNGLENALPSKLPSTAEPSGMVTDDERENNAGSAKGETGRKRSVSRGDPESGTPIKIAKV